MVTPSTGDNEAHMNELQIAAYLDRGLSVADRESLEEHLATCAECRANVVETQELLAKVRRPRKAFYGIGLIAIAAAMLFMIKPLPRSADRVATAPLMRDVPTTAQIVAYGPTGDVNLRSVRFAWAPVATVMTYRLSVSGADATPVWSASVSDTLAVLPDSVHLQPGKRYYWVADALLSDGSTRTTGLREFGPVR